MGYVPQHPVFTNNTIKENIALEYQMIKLLKKVSHVLNLVNMN